MRSEGIERYRIVCFRLQYSTLSHGSEGAAYITFGKDGLQYSTLSHGSEGC